MWPESKVRNRELSAVPVTPVRFFLAPGVNTVTFAPATGSPAAVRTTPVQAGADGNTLLRFKRDCDHQSQQQNTSLLVGRPYESLELLRVPLHSGIHA